MTFKPSKKGNSAQFLRSRRNNHRMVAPQLTIKFGTNYYKTLDWSYGGLRLQLKSSDDIPEILKSNPNSEADSSQISLLGLIVASDDDIGVFEGSMIRVDSRESAMSVRFTEVADYTYDLLDRLVRQKLTNEKV